MESVARILKDSGFRIFGDLNNFDCFSFNERYEIDLSSYAFWRNGGNTRREFEVTLACALNDLRSCAKVLRAGKTYVGERVGKGKALGIEIRTTPVDYAPTLFAMFSKVQEALKWSSLKETKVDSHTMYIIEWEGLSATIYLKGDSEFMKCNYNFQGIYNIKQWEFLNKVSSRIIELQKEFNNK